MDTGNWKKNTIIEEKMASISSGSTKRAQIQLGSRYHVGINDRKSNDGTLACLKHNKGIYYLC